MKILLFAIKAFDFVYYKLITIFDEIVKQLFKVVHVLCTVLS